VVDRHHRTAEDRVWREIQKDEVDQRGVLGLLFSPKLKVTSGSCTCLPRTAHLSVVSKFRINDQSEFQSYRALKSSAPDCYVGPYRAAKIRSLDTAQNIHALSNKNKNMLSHDIVRCVAIYMFMFTRAWRKHLYCTKCLHNWNQKFRNSTIDAATEAGRGVGGARPGKSKRGRGVQIRKSPGQRHNGQTRSHLESFGRHTASIRKPTLPKNPKRRARYFIIAWHHLASSHLMISMQTPSRGRSSMVVSLTSTISQALFV